VENRGSRMLQVGAGPNQAVVFFKALVGYPRILRRERPDLLKDILGRVVMAFIAQLIHKLHDCFPVGRSLFGNSLANKLHGTVGV